MSCFRIFYENEDEEDEDDNTTLSSSLAMLAWELEVVNLLTTYIEWWEHVTYFVLTERPAMWELPRLLIFSFICIKKCLSLLSICGKRKMQFLSVFSNTGTLRSPICSRNVCSDSLLPLNTACCPSLLSLSQCHFLLCLDSLMCSDEKKAE